MNANNDNFWSHLFRLRSGEISIVIPLAILLISNSLAMQISEIAAVSNFLNEGGVNQILIVWIVDSLLVIITTGWQSLIVDRFDRVKLMQGISLILALAFILLRLMFTCHFPGWLNYSLLYLLVGQQQLLFPIIFWLLANDILDIVQTKRLFPFIASWGFVGRLLGIGVGALAPSILTGLGLKAQEVLTLNGLIYILAYLLLRFTLNKVDRRKTIQQPETIGKTLTEGWAFIDEVVSFRYLTLSIIALMVCDVIIEFRFLAVSQATFSNPSQFQTFYSFYYLLRFLLSLAVQSFLTTRIFEKLALKNTFFIPPFCSLTATLGMITIPGLFSSVVGVLLHKVTHFTIGESASKAFQSLVPEERRGRVSIFMDNYLYAGGTILGCLIMLPIVFLGNRLDSTSYFYFYLAVGVLAALFAIWSSSRMCKVYESSLLNWRLKRRQRGKNILNDLDF